MTVDLEAIARRGHCDESSLRLALPLIQQGYSPPFLARYRRDELSGLDEAVLWSLAEAVEAERRLAARRAELLQSWSATPIADPALGRAIEKASSKRMLERLGRRIKLELNEAVDPSTRLAVRILNPDKGDGDDVKTIAEQMDSIENADAAVTNLDRALARRLAGDPRMINAAVQWLGKNAQIHVLEIFDPHISADDGASDESANEETPVEATVTAVESVSVEASAGETATATENSTAESSTAENSTADSSTAESSTAESSTAESSTAESSTAESSTAESSTAESSTGETPTSEALADETVAVADAASSSEPQTIEGLPIAFEKFERPEKRPEPIKQKKQKKVSPRQRRRRWLMSVLKPLQGKRIIANKLSSFQTVMLARALRSQVANCCFEYDANRLVAELASTAARINPKMVERLQRILIENEADIRASAEASWWDELQEQASHRLLGIAADHLRMQVNRKGVEAKVIMSIDAVGPRTAATAIVAADGRLLHCEDLPCQITTAMRSQAVLRMGELIHAYHVDLVIVSNGPARRGCLVTIGDLVKQSPENSIRWTLAERSGADAYAGSQVADREMRTTPRRFRSAAWIAFSVIQPAGAIAKVDPLKLRLGSFQRELSDPALLEVVDDVMVSGASRGGVDANSAPSEWLCRLPGVNKKVAEAIDAHRRKGLFQSRAELEDLDQWESAAARRQALPFLRVFGSSEVLDGTLVHPEDYVLAKKLATALAIELPPATPPGYEPPNFDEDLNSPSQETADPNHSAGDLTGDDELHAVDDEEDEKPFGVAADFEDPSNEADAEASSEQNVGTEEANAETVENASEETVVAEATGDAASEATGDSASNEESSNEVAASDDAGDGAVTSPAEPVNSLMVRRPRPEKAKIDKCIKEWQIGARRTHQLVNWLCDPFGDSDTSDGPASAVMTTIPSVKSLKQGDEVIGIVVGVMPFGVFVELAPDCSGLIHVSKVSEGFIEDLHEALQVGDVISAWVTGIDSKRRRVALSAISPQREIELQQLRQQQRDDRPPRGGHSRGRGTNNRGGDNRGSDNRVAENRGGENRGSENRSASDRGGNDRGGGAARTGARPERSGAPAGRGDNRGDSRSSGAGRGGAGGGRSRDSRGGDRRDSRGGRGAKQPESYRVASEKIVEPITEAMQKGAEPLRSFGDLMQFFTKETPEPKKSEPKKSESKKQKQAATDETSNESETATTVDVNATVENAVEPAVQVSKPQEVAIPSEGTSDDSAATSTDAQA